MRRFVLTGLGLFGSAAMVYLLCISAAAIQGAETEPVCFPYSIPGTALVAENMVFYEGPFFEDGSGEEVSGVAGLMIKNTGLQGIANAKVIVQQGDRELTFELTQLPPLASVMVLEKRGQRCSREPVEACSALVEYENTGWEPDAYIMIREPEPGCVEVTNIWYCPLQDLRLYYKTMYGDGSFFLGGITYEVRAGSLEPGATVCFSPPYYCSGASKILRVSFTE